MKRVSYRIQQLANGADLCFVTIPQARSVRVNISFNRAGSYFSPDGKPETAHFMEHMVFNGSEAIPDITDFNTAVSANGAWVNARTYYDRMVYTFQSPLDGMLSALDAFLGAIEKPAFNASQLPTEREIVREELTASYDEDGPELWPVISNAIGLPEPETADSIACLDSLQLVDLQRHHTQTHVTHGLEIVVSGPLNDILTAKLQERFSHLDLLLGIADTRSAITLKTPLQALTKARPRKQNLYYMLGSFQMPLLELHDSLIAQLITGYLLDFQGATIYRPARDRGLAYSVFGGWPDGFFKRTNFEIYGNVTQTNAVPLFRLIREAIGDFLSSSDSALFEQAKANVLGTRQLNFESPEAIHDRAEDLFHCYRAVDSIDETERQLRSISLTEAQTTLRTTLFSGIPVVGVLGSRTAVSDPELLRELETMRQFLESFSRS